MATYNGWLIVTPPSTPWPASMESAYNSIVATNVFKFASALAAAFPESLTTDGTNQPYWRLKENQSKWSVRRASIYGLTFEAREAI